MDIKEYIGSGIVDNYVVGAISDQERREVECMSKIYPEIAEELQAAQRAMEGFVHSLKVTPPSALRAKILEKIQGIDQEEGERDTVQSVATKQKTISMFPIRTIAAIGLILFGVSSVLFMMERNQVSSLESRIAQMEETTNNEKQTLEEKYTDLENSFTSLNKRDEIILAADTRELTMSGTEAQPTSSARIYWNESKQQMVLASDGLPAPIEGKQYQLWGIADGQPISLGVIDKDTSISNPIQLNNLKYNAFAITLEPDGGSESPTLEAMYVIVSV